MFVLNLPSCWSTNCKTVKCKRCHIWEDNSELTLYLTYEPSRRYNKHVEVTLAQHLFLDHLASAEPSFASNLQLDYDNGNSRAGYNGLLIN